ncbi:hypothetical protein ABKW28_18190 [Nocardioides sp. 31GB23]|uniref:hypothetical protein n=1 Tax=Nocardioides sp. 31GB23 TaxID=3156065 RepID=UPI0032AFDC0C
MDITGRSTSDVDVVVWEDDFLTAPSLDGLLHRLSLTEADEQFFFREAEFDAAYRQVVIELSNLDHGSSARRTLLEDLKAEIWVGHDHIGERDAGAAQDSVRRLQELLRASKR